MSAAIKTVSKGYRRYGSGLPLLLLMAVAFAVRVYRFGSVPGGFNQDEAMAAYDAFALALYGTDRFGMRLPVYFTAWGYGQMSVLLSYCMVPFIQLFGLSAVTARLPMLLASMAGLGALFVFVREWYGRAAGLVVLAFAAVCPWHIMQARWALDCNLFPHMLMLGAGLLYAGVNQRRWCLWLSMIVFGLSMYAYGVAFYTVPILMLVVCVSLLAARMVTFRQALICAGVFAGVSWCAFAVMMVNFFQWPTLRTPLFTIPFFPDTVRMNDLLPFASDIPGQLRANFQSLYQVVVTQWDGLPWNAIPGYGLLYAHAWPFTVIGLCACLFQQQNGTPGKTPNRIASGKSILLCWLGVSIITGLTVNGVNINRVNIIAYPLMILTGLGLYEAVRLPLRLIQQQRTAQMTALAAAICLSLSYGMSFTAFNRAYFGSHNNELSRLFYKGFFDCLAYAEREDFDRLRVTAWTQYPGGVQVSEILTLYGLRINPALYQNKTVYNRHFSYEVFDGILQPEDEGKTLYIFNEAEAYCFPADLFAVHMFDHFGVAVKIGQ